MTERPTSEAWKLVPVEPTEEMLDAFVTVKPLCNPQDGARVYCAMLASAPASPAIGIQAVKALEALINDVQEWVDAVGRGTSWDYWDHHYKHLAYGGLDKYRAAIEAALHPAPEAASAGAAGEVDDYDPRIAELQEIQDGAWGDNPMVRGAARDLIASRDTPSDTAPSPAAAERERIADELDYEASGVSDGVRADAARYRWLRDSTGGRSNRWPHVTQYPHQPNIDRNKPPQIMRGGEYRGEYLDEAIDAAMQVPPERLLNEPARQRAAALSQEHAPGRKESQL